MEEVNEFTATRLRRSLIVIVVMFAVVIFRLGHLQLVMGQYYLELSDGNRVRTMESPAPRGEMVDRHQEVVATNRPAFSVSLVYTGEPAARIAVPRLSAILKMDEAAIWARIRAQRNRLYQPVRIASDISPAVHSQLEERRAELPGVVIQPEPVRHYPFGAAAAHLIGYVHRITTQQLAQPAFAQHLPDAIVGQYGLERMYERYLAGQSGGRQVEVDARGRYRQTLRTVEPVPGYVLNLTIDIKLQRDIEAYLAEQLERLRNRAEEPMLNARAGSVVVLDLHTGAVLAMVTHPQYDPNEFAGGITQARFDELQRLFAFVNRSVANTYPPGSAFKMAAALAGLEAGVISRSEQVLCTGRHWMVPTLACWKEGGHGYVDVEEALAVSCNVFFYEVGRRVGVDAIARYAAQLGLGSLTGIDLPSEQAGILPTTAWKRERFPREPQFFLAEHMMAAMGQGFHRYTPLQMAVFAATLATGYGYQPFVVDSITGGGGEVIYRHQPRVASQLQVAPENLAVVRRGMLNATRPGGTAAGAFWGFGIPVAGKTGTAEVGNGDAHGWFVGYAPYHQPQVAIAVLLEHGGSAGLSAAPLARRVLARVLQTR